MQSGSEYASGLSEKRTRAACTYKLTIVKLGEAALCRVCQRRDWRFERDGVRTCLCRCAIRVQACYGQHTAVVSIDHVSAEEGLRTYSRTGNAGCLMVGIQFSGAYASIPVRGKA